MASNNSKRNKRKKSRNRSNTKRGTSSQAGGSMTTNSRAGGQAQKGGTTTRRERFISFIRVHGLLVFIIATLLSCGVWVVEQIHSLDLQVAMLETEVKNYAALHERVIEIEATLDAYESFWAFKPEHGATNEAQEQDADLNQAKIETNPETQTSTDNPTETTNGAVDNSSSAP